MIVALLLICALALIVVNISMRMNRLERCLENLEAKAKAEATIPW